MTLVEATCCIRRRTVTLWVPMANSPSRLAAATLMASGSESGAPINTTRKKAVRTAHSKPNIHGRGVRPRRSSLTAMTVVIMPATRKIGIANTFVSTSCSCRIAAAAVSTKLPVTCATNNPNSASTVKLSMNPAVKLKSGGTMVGGRRRDGSKSSLMADVFRSTGSTRIGSVPRKRQSTSTSAYRTTQTSPKDALTPEPLWLKPIRQPIDCFVHLPRRTRVAETNEMSALDRIKIDARCRRHVRLRQHALGELEAVVAEARHIGVEVEGPVNRQKFIEPSTRQAFEQNAAILLVAMLDYLHFRAPVECRLGRDLREGRHRDGEIALQPVERAHERFRHDHPADAPASHAEIFRERIDDHAV